MLHVEKSCLPQNTSLRSEQVDVITPAKFLGLECPLAVGLLVQADLATIAPEVLCSPQGALR